MAVRTPVHANGSPAAYPAPVAPAASALRAALLRHGVKPKRKVTIPTASEGVHVVNVNGWCAPTVGAARDAIRKGGASCKELSEATVGAVAFGDQSYKLDPGAGAVETFDALVTAANPTPAE